LLFFGDWSPKNNNLMALMAWLVVTAQLRDVTYGHLFVLVLKISYALPFL